MSIFVSAYLPIEHHQVERFRDGLRQELEMVLITMPFQSIRELEQAAQGMKKVIQDILKLVSEQGHMTRVKRRDFVYSTSRSPLLKRGKNRQSSGQFQRRGSFIVGGESRGSRQITNGGSSGGLDQQGANAIKWVF